MLSLLVILACGGAQDATQPATSSGPAPAAPAAATAPASTQDPSGVVATWTGGQISYSEVQARLGKQLVMMEVEYLQGRYNAERQSAEELALRALIDAEAKARSLTTDALLKAEVQDKIPKPTQAQLEEVYPYVRRQMRTDAPLEAILEQVTQAWTRNAENERMAAYLDELKAKHGLKIQLPYPNLPKIEVSADDDPTLGDAAATVTIVEFADYQCGYCRKVYPTLVELLDEYKGKVKVVYRDYPLGGPNPSGMGPSIAANCAGSQGKYWEMHDVLMRTGDFSASGMEATAGTLGLDVTAYKACVSEPTSQVAEITADFEAGQAAGISGTPAFFINGVFLNGAVPKEVFKAVIDKELGG